MARAWGGGAHAVASIVLSVALQPLSSGRLPASWVTLEQPVGPRPSELQSQVQAHVTGDEVASRTNPEDSSTPPSDVE